MNKLDTKERAKLISKAISTMALIAKLGMDGLTKEEVTVIVQSLYDLASKIQEHYKD
jgi:hypothetical protein